MNISLHLRKMKELCMAANEVAFAILLFQFSQMIVCMQVYNIQSKRKIMQIYNY